MTNFEYFNPTKVFFGNGSISKLSQQLTEYTNVLLMYGSGSIKKNGVYEQVKEQLCKKNLFEFSGITHNPKYKHLLEAVELCKKNKIEFILAVGGGSVIDSAKFVSAANHFQFEDKWRIVCGEKINCTTKIGVVLTLPATGSEMNQVSSIFNEETLVKRSFKSELLFPQFSIIDPEYSYSLPDEQIINGVIDSFTHAIEQYLTYDVGAELQYRFCESVLMTIIEFGLKCIFEDKRRDYRVRANLAWAATNAFNGYIGAGVVHDWSTHRICNELTALYGIPHARSLAVVLPGVIKNQLSNKKEMLDRFFKNVLNQIKHNIDFKDPVNFIENFFIKLGAKTRLSQYEVPVSDLHNISRNIMNTYQSNLGERKNLDQDAIFQILTSVYQ